MRGLERGGQLVVAVVLDLSLDQLVSGPHQLWVLSQIVSLCSCAVLLLGVPVAERDHHNRLITAKSADIIFSYTADIFSYT